MMDSCYRGCLWLCGWTASHMLARGGPPDLKSSSYSTCEVTSRNKLTYKPFPGDPQGEGEDFLSWTPGLLVLRAHKDPNLETSEAEGQGLLAKCLWLCCPGWYLAISEERYAVGVDSSSSAPSTLPIHLPREGLWWRPVETAFGKLYRLTQHQEESHCVERIR